METISKDSPLNLDIYFNIMCQRSISPYNDNVIYAQPPANFYDIFVGCNAVP